MTYISPDVSHWPLQCSILFIPLNSLLPPLSVTLIAVYTLPVIAPMFISFIVNLNRHHPMLIAALLLIVNAITLQVDLELRSPPPDLARQVRPSKIEAF